MPETRISLIWVVSSWSYIHPTNEFTCKIGPSFRNSKRAFRICKWGMCFSYHIYIYICVCALSISFHTDDGMEHERAKKTGSKLINYVVLQPLLSNCYSPLYRSRKRMGSCSRRDRIGRWKLIPNVEHYKYVSPNTKQPNRKQWLYKCWICHVGPLMGHGWDLHQLTLPKLRPITRRAPYWGLILGDGTTSYVMLRLEFEAPSS